MRFEFQHGLIWIAIIIVYESISIDINHCIIDTGSATTAIDINLVTFNYQNPTLIRRLCGLGGGTQEVVYQAIDRFKIDATELSPVDIEFGDISSTLGINGFIGNDILSQGSLTIDFLEQEIEIVPQK